MNLSLDGRIAVKNRTVVPWRTGVTTAVLALVLGTTLLQDPGAAHFSTLTASSAKVLAPGSGTSHKGLSSLPGAALGPVSQTFGADNAAYQISASGGAFQAVNPSQRLRLRFGRSGVVLSSGTLRLGLSLQAVGLGSAIRGFDDLTPRARANRVVYTRAGLSEWYVNGPLGLEQGFTIARAPAGDRAARLTLSMTLSGDAHGALASDGQSVTLADGDGPSLRYGGLLATDAIGRVLRSRLLLRPGRLLLRVDGRGAHYPLRIDPLIQQGSKLTGAGEIGEGGFGSSVALSSDGNTALIGAPNDNGKAGAAWVFTRSGSTWIQQGSKLTAPGETGEGGFGSSVALSSDGNTALIGAPNDNGKAGAAWVLTRSGSTWTQQGPKLTGAGEIQSCCGGDFGHSVALSSDGNTALVGGFDDNDGTGAAWVFTRSGSGWAQQGEKLTANPGEEIIEGGFGSSVALSSDGNTALIGGAGHGFDGAAWVFTRSGSAWAQQGTKLAAASGEASEDFGESAALSSDGNTALIGAVNFTLGAAWAFTRSGSAWTQLGTKLTGGSEELGTGHFGWSVALSSDANTALIGAFSDKVRAESESKLATVGTACVFTRSGSTFSQQPPKLVAQTGEMGEGHFGQSVALSSDASTALIGGPNDNGGVGAAWVLVRPTAPATPAAMPTPARTPLILANVAQSNRIWREGKALAVFARTHKSPPIGTTFSFALNEQASVRLAFTQRIGGRRVKGKCVAQTKANRGKAACKRSTTPGTLSFTGHGGPNRVSFQGLVSRSKKLRTGSYTLVITAKDAAGQQAGPRMLSFSIVK